MEQLCLELDELLVKYCDTLQQLTEVKQRMHSAMRQGFYNLSKARNSMGKEQVGALQFDYSRMKAQTHVKHSESQDGSFCSFQLENQRLSGVTNVGCSDNLHKRQTGHISSGNQEDSTPADQDPLMSKDGTNDGELFVDPLRWFGILVPPALRHCQSDFVNALQECSHVASLQNQLLAIRREYMSLQKKKTQQMDATSDENGS